MGRYPLLVHDAGMGDCILQAGGVVELVKRHGGLRFPCWQHSLNYQGTMAEIFKDVPNVEIVNLTDMWQMVDMDGPLILTGHYKSKDHFQRVYKPIDQIFYDEIDVPLQRKWESFPWKPNGNLRLQPPNYPYIFVHHAPLWGLTIHRHTLHWPQDRMVCPNEGDTRYLMVDWANILINASEIHVINSAFLHFAEALDLPTYQPKFFHRYARGWNIWDLPTFHHPNWITVDIDKNDGSIFYIHH